MDGTELIMTWKKISISIEELEDIESSHARGTHSPSCSPRTCSKVAISHKSDHKLCNEYNCKKVGQKHHNGDHSLCDTYWCWPLHQINESHSEGSHSGYCSPESCSEVAESHKTDHKICNQWHCNFISQIHATGDHSRCNDYWDIEKIVIEENHKKGEHCSFCKPRNCEREKQKAMREQLDRFLELDLEDKV